MDNKVSNKKDGLVVVATIMFIIYGISVILFYIFCVFFGMLGDAINSSETIYIFGIDQNYFTAIPLAIDLPLMFGGFVPFLLLAISAIKRKNWATLIIDIVVFVILFCLQYID